MAIFLSLLFMDVYSLALAQEHDIPVLDALTGSVVFSISEHNARPFWIAAKMWAVIQRSASRLENRGLIIESREGPKWLADNLLPWNPKTRFYILVPRERWREVNSCRICILPLKNVPLNVKLNSLFVSLKLCRLWSKAGLRAVFLPSWGILHDPRVCKMYSTPFT